MKKTTKKTTSRSIALALCFIMAVLYAIQLSKSDRVALDWVIIGIFSLGFLYNAVDLLRIVIRKNRQKS
jgi:hypothetical protein